MTANRIEANRKSALESIRKKQAEAIIHSKGAITSVDIYQTRLKTVSKLAERIIDFASTHDWPLIEPYDIFVKTGWWGPKTFPGAGWPLQKYSGGDYDIYDEQFVLTSSGEFGSCSVGPNTKTPMVSTMSTAAYLGRHQHEIIAGDGLRRLASRIGITAYQGH